MDIASSDTDLAGPHSANAFTGVRLDKLHITALAAALIAGCGSAPPRARCTVPADALQWQADYCMYVSQSDDPVAAQACMESESRRHFVDDCARIRYYQRVLARLKSSQPAR